MSLKPDYVRAHKNMGVVLINQGKLEEAIEATKALSLKPDYAEASHILSALLVKQPSQHQENM